MMSSRSILSSRNCHASHLLAIVCVLSSHVAIADEYRPNVASASREAQLAVHGFVLPDGMSGSLVAAEPMLANPVAFHVAHDGKIYVCETFRQQVGVEDNRSHMNWLENDLRLESVEERLAMFRRYLGKDVEAYGREHDRIRLLQDTDGDGVIDTDTVFAEGFNGILDGTGAGVIEADGDVYYTCIPRLWRLSDENGDGTADVHDPLHHGYGVRVAFRGHDMHGLTRGPDGRIYFSIGDRGYNVITPEGQRLKRPDTGAVFRCDLDGTHLEVFAYGLRNPQELAFDNFGNLFTGDNNSDSGDMARWVYVVQDGDSGWRMYFQYESDRGPWNRERMWYPYRADTETTAVQPAYIVPPVANLGDGPSGLTYYPGLGLPERYQNHFFMADFRGTAGNSGIRSFSVEPLGATFSLTDSHEFIWSILGTDVDFAPDGSLYVSDWVNGWVGEGKGRIYRFAHSAHVSEVSGANVPQLLKGGIKAAAIPKLVNLLAHADRRIRQESQFELVKREAVTELIAAAEGESSQLSSVHGTWGLWQLGLKSRDNASAIAATILQLIESQSGETQIQAVRVLTDLMARHGVSEVLNDQRDSALERLRHLTESPDLRLAGFAAVAVGKCGRLPDVESLRSLLRRNDGADPVVRHQAVMGLTSLAQRSPQVLNAGNDSHVSERLATVLAMRRLQDYRITRFLTDSSPAVVLEAARAINDEPIAAGLPALASLIDGRELPDPMLRRVLNACYRLGEPAHAASVALFAADSSRPEVLRLVAARMLETWNSPRNTDPVTGRWNPVGDREVYGLDRAVETALPAMFQGPADLQAIAVKIAGQLKIRSATPAIESFFADQEVAVETRLAAFAALAAVSETTSSLIQRGLSDTAEPIRIAALELFASHAPDKAIPALQHAIRSDTPRATQAALRLLGAIRTTAAEQILLEEFNRLSEGQLPKESVLDLLTAAESHGTNNLTAALSAFRNSQAAQGTNISGWTECLYGGDAKAGETVFFGRAAVSCRRCHKVHGDGGEVGPDLSAIGKEKDREYLLEAIVAPDAKIAKGFETVILVTVDGKIHSGIIKHEDADVVKLMTPQGATVTVLTEDIEERAKGKSGMPDDLVKYVTRSEIRDLVEYLATRRGTSAASHGHE